MSIAIHRASVQTGANLPLVSVVITGRNEAEMIGRCIKSVLEQDYPNFEMVFVDAKSTDGTYEKVVELQKQSASYSNCKSFAVISANADTPGIGRNIGVDSARGQVIAFTDADCLPDKNWLTKLVDLLGTQIGIVGGPNLLKHTKSNMVLSAIDAVLGTTLGSGGTPQFLDIDKVSEVYALPACNMAMSKATFEEVGGFDAKLKYNEDSDLCNKILKKGLKILFNPKAKVSHYIGFESFSGFSKFLFKYGYHRGRNAANDPRLFTKFNLASIAFIFAFVVIASVSVFEPTFRIILADILLLLGLVLAVSAVRLGLRKRSLSIGLLSIPLYISIFCVYNYAFLKGYVEKAFT